MWFGKAKAKQCYISLLVWIILVSIGLYWFMNRNGRNGLTALVVSNDPKGKGPDQLAKIDEKQNEDSDAGNTGKYSLENADLLNSYASSKKRKTKAERNKAVESFTKGVSDSSQKYSNFINSYANPNYNANKYLHSSVTRLCNPEDSIKAQDENVQLADYKLDALIILFRHGDRGPLSHWHDNLGGRNVSHINCTSENPDFHSLIRYATETMAKQTGYSQFIGPFHSFPKVPSSSQCNLGQLTQQGASQLITLGKTIRKAYQSNIFNLSTPSAHVKAISYSTRYRRTFQSLIAFLYGILGPKMLIPSTTIKESQSITFCFNHCSCRAADKLKKIASKKYKPDTSERAAMSHLINQLNSIVSVDKTKKTGTSLLDSLLIYPCHKAELPCRHQSKVAVKDYNASSRKNTNSDCVTRKDLSNLIKLIQRENHGLKKISHNRKFFLLSSYGLLREIVTLALKMTSSSSTSFASASSSSNTNSNNINISNNNNNNYNNNIKLAIFSGHDTTLQSLTGALGIFAGHPDIHLPPYASRLIFEFYRKTNVPPNSARKHFFRIIYNGQAVTHLVTFCKDATAAVKVAGNQDGTDKNGKKYTSLLCPMENLLRFLLDNYFESFENSTNFKDACSPRTMITK